MMLLDIHWYLKLLGLIKLKALMIKINVITNNVNWFHLLKILIIILIEKLKN